MNATNTTRIAWLLPSVFFYWQSPLKEFKKAFPETKIFTGRWHGFAPGLEGSLSIEIVGNRKILRINRKTTGYGTNFTILSPSIIRHLLRYKPDVIFSNSFGLWTLFALLVKALGRWRVVIAYEGSSPDVDCLNSPLRLALRRLMVSAADAFITNSQTGKSYLTTYLNAPEDRVFVQPYEVPDFEVMTHTHQDLPPTDISPKRPSFLFVGRLIPHKGINLLLEACSELQKEGYRDYTVLVVGDGDERQSLEELARQNDLETCVKWIGRVDYSQMSLYLQTADVFVLPTLEDTWGVSILEAMLFGRPILCSNGAGASELIIEGENGYIFDPHEPKALAERMKWCIEHPDSLQVMGDHSKEIMKQYTPENASKFFTQVVETLL